MGENVGCRDTLTDLRRLGADDVPSPLLPPAETVDVLTSDSSWPGTASVEGPGVGEGENAGTGEGAGTGESRFSRTVRNDATDPLSLPSPSPFLPLRAGESGGGGGVDSTTTRGGAEGITIGVGGSLGGGEAFRNALRNGIFGGAVPGGGVGTGTRGGGGSETGRRGVDGADDGVASTLPGASTDSNAIPPPPSPRRSYFVTDGGARTVNKLPTVLVPPAGSGGRPAFARSQAVRLSRVTPSTIAMSDIWADPARAALVRGGGGGMLAYITDLLFPW